jgi:hypothetical protein
MTKIERARAMAVEAGVDPAVVQGKPVEVEHENGSTIVTWGCSWVQACATEAWRRDIESCPSVSWYEEHAEVLLSEDVFTWEGFPRWSVWVWADV